MRHPPPLLRLRWLLLWLHHRHLRRRRIFASADGVCDYEDGGSQPQIVILYHLHRASLLDFLHRLWRLFEGMPYAALPNISIRNKKNTKKAGILATAILRRSTFFPWAWSLARAVQFMFPTMGDRSIVLLLLEIGNHKVCSFLLFCATKRCCSVATVAPSIADDWIQYINYLWLCIHGERKSTVAFLLTGEKKQMQKLVIMIPVPTGKLEVFLIDCLLFSPFLHFYSQY